MQIPISFMVPLALFVPLTAWGAWKARTDYRRHGRQTVFGLVSVCAVFLAPNLMLDAFLAYEIPATLIDIVGVVVGTLGLALCLAGMLTFGSSKKVLCLDSGKLTVFGIYRWSRNPQYVGGGMILLAFALNHWSFACLFGLVGYLIAAHVLVLVEEEHLRRVFGDTYDAYCQKVPRYLV